MVTRPTPQPRTTRPAPDVLVIPNEPTARAALPPATTVTRESRGYNQKPPIPRPTGLRGSRLPTAAAGRGRRLDHPGRTIRPDAPLPNGTLTKPGRLLGASTACFTFFRSNPGNILTNRYRDNAYRR